MQTFQINVQVNVKLDSALCALLSSVVNRPAPVVELPASPESKKPTNPQSNPQPTENPIPEAKPEPEATKEKAKPEPTKEETKEYTVMDVRAAMQKTRKRIEGDDYKENPDGEGYKTWHRVLTDWFIRTSKMLGADKPINLPDSESRAKFITICETVHVKDGRLAENYPF